MFDGRLRGDRDQVDSANHNAPDPANTSQWATVEPEDNHHRLDRDAGVARKGTGMETGHMGQARNEGLVGAWSTCSAGRGRISSRSLWRPQHQVPAALHPSQATPVVRRVGRPHSRLHRHRIFLLLYGGNNVEVHSQQWPQVETLNFVVWFSDTPASQG